MTDADGRTFVIDVQEHVGIENTTPEQELKALQCENGKEVAVVRIVYTYLDDNGHEVTKYEHWIKALADLNIKEIRFHN